MSHRTYTIGVCGAGKISDIYLTNMTTQFSELQVKSICAAHLENAKKKADTYHLLACTYDEMLADPEIDLIVILTPAFTHYSLIKQALLAGKHVYTEKTITEELDQALELQTIAKQHNLYLCSAPDTFLGAAIQTAKDAIDKGKIGTVTGFSINVNRNMDIIASIFPTNTQPGGGIVEDYGVYHLTALCTLLGPVGCVAAIEENTKPVRVNRIPNHPNFNKEYASPNDNMASAIIQMRSGITGTMHVNGESILHDMAYIYIYGTEGIMKLSDPNQFGGSITILRNGRSYQDITEETLPPVNSYSDNFRGLGPAEMVQAISENRTAKTDCALAIHVLDVCTAIKNSSDTKTFKAVASSF